MITMKGYIICVKERGGIKEKKKKERWCDCVSFNQHALPSFELHKRDAMCPI